MERLESLLPILCLTAYFLAAIAGFSVRTLRHGLPSDPEVEGRPASRLLGRYLRHYMMWVLAPYERLLVRMHVSPNMVTFASLLTAFASAGCLTTGRFAAGGWLYLLTGMLDILDGRVARATDRVTAGGAFFDSVIDRYAELAVFSGLAFYYRNSWVLAVVLAAATGSVMVSYVRARGEALGVDVKVGTMQRPERLFYLGMMVAESPLFESFFGGSIGSGAHPLHPFAVAALVLLGLSANATAIRRILYTLRLLQVVEVANVIPHPAQSELLGVTSSDGNGTQVVSDGTLGGAATSAESDAELSRRRGAEAAHRILAPVRPMG